MKKEKKKAIYTARPKRMSFAASEEHEDYDIDFFKWTVNQAKLLKKQEFSKLDIENLIEEIESLGRSERNAIESYLIVLFLHLLKMKYQPAMRCNSWENSVENAKFRIKRLVQKNPSLRKEVPKFIPDAYYSARLQASSETGFNKETFPEKCPWSFEHLFPDLLKK